VRRWRLALVAAAAAAALGCTGCATALEGHGTPSADVVAAPPDRGACWQLRTTDFGSALDQPERRPCTQPHEAETFWVATDVLDRTLAYPSEAQAEDVSGVVGKALDNSCNWRAVSAFLGDEALKYTPFVNWMGRLPSRAQWAAGARWVRCDVIYGVDAPRTAPGRLAGGLNGAHKAAFRVCYDGTPTVHQFVPCSETHQAEIVSPGVDLGDGVAFPTDPGKRRALAESVCGDDLAFVLGEDPRPAGLQLDLYREPWNQTSGPFTVSCVLDRADGGWSTTIALP
jgi:hypothetical protein